MINLSEDSSSEESAFVLSEKEKSLGFILADVEHFDISQADYFERSVIYILSESDAIFKTYSAIHECIMYSHRRWGSREGDDDWFDWAPITNPIEDARTAIFQSSLANESCYYKMKRGAFKYIKIES